ncbi:hypothetical protein CQW49_07270 [Methylosinus trichosporium OB3b]|uniref:Uncharacterized protein n=2 Tax=Methylocystaceae TaxID=31993 RepID=A0A2D2CY91_METT3|nr:hypothetical protein CQW49_07270 [Methylosinus trichosporium OB3b]OBS51180.1 hypothetical protein A8B73_17835 [Methylosinus sp. 3S-1]
MTTKLPPTTAGIARDFNRSNTLEIAFVAALTDIGYAPIDAAARASRWLAEEARGELAPWWVENRKTGNGTFLSTAAQTISIARLASEVFMADDPGDGVLVSDDDPGDGPADDIKPASRMGVIHIAGIVEAIDALFNKPRE